MRRCPWLLVMHLTAVLFLTACSPTLVTVAGVDNGGLR